MEEELGVSTPSSVKRGGADTRPSSLFAYYLPYFMAYGMTYEQFWYEDVCLAKYYLEMQNIKNQMRNQEMWLQGRYFLDAIACNFNKSYKYPKEPYPLSIEEKEEREEQERINRMYAYMGAFTRENNKEKEG